MPDTIVDGGTTSRAARVNSDGNLIVRSIDVEQRLASALDENYYEATTGVITLTDAAETPMIYLKNTRSDGFVLVLDRFFYDVWTSASGTGLGTLKYYRNPTVTGGTDITPNNTNYGTPAAADGDFTKSQTTMTGTVWWTAAVAEESSAALEEGRIVLKSGSSHGVSLAAPTSNTSMAVSLNVAFYFMDPKLV